MLRENAALLSSSKAYLDAGHLGQAVGFLESVHGNMLHLGRLADVQTIRHGLPPESSDTRTDCGLSPRDELLQTFTQSLMAHYMKPPPRARELAAAGASAGSEEGGSGGGGVGGGGGGGGSSSSSSSSGSSSSSSSSSTITAHLLSTHVFTSTGK